MKNKLASPFRKAEFDIRYGKGIDAVGDLMDRAVEAGVIEKSGAYYRFKGKNLAQGRENARAALDTNSKVREEVAALLAQALTGEKRAA